MGERLGLKKAHVKLLVLDVADKSGAGGLASSEVLREALKLPHVLYPFLTSFSTSPDSNTNYFLPCRDT